LPAERPLLQEIRWLLLSLNSSARAVETSVSSDSAKPKQILMTWFIRIIPMTWYVDADSKPKPEDSRDGGYGKSQSLMARTNSQRQVVLPE
jgi:hypothetical protein